MGRKRQCCQALDRSLRGTDLRYWRNSRGDEIGLGNKAGAAELSAGGGGIKLETLAEGPIGAGRVSGVSIAVV